MSAMKRRSNLRCLLSLLSFVAMLTQECQATKNLRRKRTILEVDEMNPTIPKETDSWGTEVVMKTKKENKRKKSATKIARNNIGSSNKTPSGSNDATNELIPIDQLTSQEDANFVQRQQTEWSTRDLMMNDMEESIWRDLQESMYTYMSVDFSMSMPPTPPKPAPVPVPTTSPDVPSPTRPPSTSPPQIVVTPSPTTSPVAVPTVPTNPPIETPVPVDGCAALSRKDAMREQLLEVTEASILDDDDSPQGKAFEFLLSGDPLQVDPCTYSTLFQRYALVTLYYSTEGDNWVESENWLSDMSECLWYGIVCEDLNEVTSIMLVANNLKGEIPSEIRILMSLEEFVLHSNKLEGSIPDVLFQMTRLRLFDVEDNLLTGQAIVDVRGLDSLESYRVSVNRLEGTISPEISEARGLKELWLANNALITGTIPHEIGKLTNLESLFIYRCELTGTLPSAFSSLNLSEFQAHVNHFTGTIPQELFLNTNLELLRLDFNNLSGSIPADLGVLRRLYDFRVEENFLSGILPPSFTALTELRVLRVNSNFLYGAIRNGFHNMQNLDFVDFSSNSFTGTIPETIFNTPVRILYFSNNGLDGPIPSNYGEASNLKDFFIDNNILTGTVPDIQPGQLPDLTEFLLQDNQLTGVMAPSICQLRVEGSGILDDLWADCGEDASFPIECDFPECCTLCAPVMDTEV